MLDAAEVQAGQNPGLTAAEAQARFAQLGPNRIFRASPVRFWAIAREEITEPMILLLLIVGVVYSLWGELGDALTIFAVIAVLVFVEIYNEFRAKRAIAALEQIAAPKARVVRDGTVVDVDAEALVHGDLLVLTPGTRIAADARVTQARDLASDESALTGESNAVEKNAGEAIYAGTLAVAGEGVAVVTATGASTRIGGIARTLEQVARPKTPLQLAMKALAGRLVWVATGFAALIPLIGILQGQDFRQMILTGLSLAFATIPEELPIIIAMVLGLGAYELSRNNFLVKRLHAAETLGDVTVIVTDKTGTITESAMTVASVYPPQRADAVLETALANVSEHVGDPLERALVETAAQHGRSRRSSVIVRVRLVGNGRKTKATLRRESAGYRLFVSGAPEEVRRLCRDIIEGYDDFIRQETANGRRVIAIASRTVSPEQAELSFASLQKNLEIAGVVSFEDPPRAGVKETIARAAAAGIRTLMVTGDHPATAVSIARQVGIPADSVLTHSEVEPLSDAALEEALRRTSVFARSTPEDKYRIVQALQRSGEVVAVTGDGVNDALALKGADIGIAMGIKGTDIAKEAAQVVLADDNYVTVTRGVFEGRKFYDNLRKGVVYYLSVKAGLILIFLLPAVTGLPMPFSPIQIIVLELFMDLAASAGFVAEPAEASIFVRRPQRRGATLLDRRAVLLILGKGVLLFAAVMAAYGLSWLRGASATEIQTAAFVAWMAGHIVLAFVSRSQTQSLLAIGPLSNRVLNGWALGAVLFLIAAIYVPAVQERLKFAPLDLGLLMAAASIAIAITAVGAVPKLRGAASSR